MHNTIKKGQGATEYLVLLAVVLIVAMVAIALLGYFPGIAGDSMRTQADAYWKSTRPFSIVEHAQISNSPNMTLVLQNVDSLQQEITNISITGSGVTGEANVFLASGSNGFFSPGEKKKVTIELHPANGDEWEADEPMGCISGNNYEYQLLIIYNSPTITKLQQSGEKPIIGKCS
jgi:archaellum component FlaG (FlaF/FlaG flagellin family)